MDAFSHPLQQRIDKMNDSTTAIETSSPTWEFAHSYPIIALLTVSYATIFIAGLLGNFAVITIVLRNHHMRSVTNIFICNLSVADLLVTVFVEPLTLLQNIVVGWHWGATTCWCVPYLQGISVCASSLSLLVIALDRYLAVCFPMKRLIRRSLAKKIIAVIWVVSAVLFIPWAYYFRLSQAPDGLINCREFWPSVTADRAFFLGVVTLLVYTIPLLFMAFCYCSIIFRVWTRVRKDQSTTSAAKSTNSDESRATKVTGALYSPPMEIPSEHERRTGSEVSCYVENQRSETKTMNSYATPTKFIKVKDKSHQVRLHPVGGINRVKTVKIIKMLAIVVINFCICWLPLFTIFNIIKFSPTYLAVDFNTSAKAADEESSMLVESSDDNLMRVIFLVVPFAQLLGSANSCVNPWIYCFYSKRYRHGFKRVFLCRSMKAVSVRRPPRPQPTTSHFHRDHNLALRSVEQTASA
ncbi:unnamed protein product [Taenia asiatica]|uniref:G_PROTEIN_RECEP_F1_2 domain-containing protein n=1 Tax=Taenia asiatica TaxID=60517 RepID=A0A0R3W1X6_TAEAS|nr:unnamed protein product [Taenia asiatica]